MKISFLGQGFEPESKKSVGNQIVKLFKQDKFNSFTGISAFASEAGVAGLSKCIKSGKDYYETLNLIVGIDQEGTSKQALKRINELSINSYIFYQKESPIFHPKIYLFEGVSDTVLIVGSSNLTARGFFGNVESSLKVEFQNDNPEGKTLIAELKEYYSSLFDFSDPNLFKISDEIIDSFVKNGVVPTKKIWMKKHQKHTSKNKATNDDLTIPKRPTSSIPKFFKGSYKSKRIVRNVIEELEKEGEFEINEENNLLVWQSGELTKRTLNIPTGENTNPTGSMGMTKGALQDIDHRHHFRNVVYSELDWEFDLRPSKSHLERAIVNMRMIILGIDYGIYNLKLSHNTKTDTTSYSQKNSMTQLSWGEAKNLVGQEELIGKTAKIYKNQTAIDVFTLIIE